MSPFGNIPQPKSLLEFYRVLSPTAGIRVSPLCLGSMNFSDAWEEYMGKCDKNMTFEILDFFYEQGGNFIDTRTIRGLDRRRMAARKNRNEIVLATKFSICYPNPRNAPRQKVNYAGNSTKSMQISLAASLEKLQTSYIDLLYVHWWDFTTGIPEMMQSLNHLVVSGKVLYLGISDTAAWVVSKANEYARNHGLRPFSVYQGQWSAAQRGFERDVLPMARDEGMALAPWGVLGGGNFTTKAKQADNEKGRNFGPASEAHIKLSMKLEAIAIKYSTAITSIALAYIRAKYPYVYPIVGGRKVEHLKGNIEALSISLSDEEVDEIDGESDFQVAFPMDLLFELGTGAKYSTRATSADVVFLKFAGTLDGVPHARGPQPHRL